jgi:hypothetical protein
VKDIFGNLTTGFCSGQQVFKLNISGGKKAAFAARTMGLTAAMKRVEPANSTQTDDSLTTQARVAVEHDHGFQLMQVQNDDGTVKISYTLPEDAENVFVGLWNKFAFHVRTLVSEKMQLRGKQTIIWDGKEKTIREIRLVQASLSAGCVPPATRAPAS